MRPDELNILFTEVQTLKGVGDKVRLNLARLLGKLPTQPLYLRDLVFLLPTGGVDRRYTPKVMQAKDEEIATITITVEAHQPPPEATRFRANKPPYKVWCTDDTGHLTLVFFHAHPDWLEKQLPVGQQRIVSGKFERSDKGFQMVHPDIIAPLEEKDKVIRFEPTYPLTAGISQKKVQQCMDQVLERLPDLAEWIDPHYLAQQHWAAWREALTKAHNPQSPEDMHAKAPAIERLAYDEILANQLALALVRKRIRKATHIRVKSATTITEKLKASLPFQLTQGQVTILDELEEDITSGQRMLRLLQGDVGSGKTVVALLAMARLIESGYQAALMVPTEILGRQHVKSFQSLCAKNGINVALLTGSIKGKEREDILQGLQSGNIDIVIGTHALFQEKVQFKALGMVVIDEQHRFGVSQRLALAAKGKTPHILLMTATPIPRSLTMTMFGDMDSSQLTEKPKGRQEIATRATPTSRMDEILLAVKRALERGEKVYWICPLVEDDPDNVKQDLAATEARYQQFKTQFGEALTGMAHGKMKAEERQQVMQQFASGQKRLLVATTVVEVGVDVPDATIMIIEQAERFGLAQLHQLRGRVGRGTKSSSCLLLYGQQISEVAKKRLHIMRQTNNGFKIAEEDLLLRGSGELLGTRQSGIPNFHFVDMVAHQELIRTAHTDVKLLLNQDEQLEASRGQALRSLLYLFGYDESIQFLNSG